MCEHLGRCSVPSAYNTSAGSAEPLTSRPNERIKGGQGELDLNLSRRNGKRQSGRNQATGRKLQVGQLDSRTGLGCLTMKRGCFGSWSKSRCWMSDVSWTWRHWSRLSQIRCWRCRLVVEEIDLRRFGNSGMVTQTSQPLCKPAIPRNLWKKIIL